MKQRTVGRRRFLLSTGLLTIAAPFVDVLTSQAATPPSRMVLLFHGNGHRRGQWAARHSDTDFDFLRISEPLEPFRNDTLLFRNLNHYAMRRSTLRSTKHGHGSGIAWTGTGVTDTGWPTGISVDQFVAGRVGGESPIRSLQLGSGCNDTNVYGRVSFAEAGRPLAPQQIPANVYADLFAPLLQQDDDGANATAERLLARKKSVLDFVTQDVCTLRAELGTEDRARLDAHCEAIREVERSLGAGVGAGAQCEEPGVLVSERHSGGNYEQSVKDHIALTRLALACRLTRVVSLQMGQAHGGVVANQVGVSTAEGGHHHISHYRGSGQGDDPYIRISIWYSQMVALLLGSLQSVDEGGSTLLDNTVLAWGSDISDGEEHGEDDIPWAVFGGRNLGIRGGRMLDVNRRNANDLLISLCHAMGQNDVTTFGHADLCAGPLPLG